MLHRHMHRSQAASCQQHSSYRRLHRRAAFTTCSKSTDSALSDLRKAVRSKPGGFSDNAHNNAAQYLKTIGFTNQAELARVLDIATNPTSLFMSYRDPKRAYNASARPLTVEEDIVPVVEFLQSKGLGPADLVRVISAHPPLLSYCVQERLLPFWDYLEKEVGIADAGAVVVKRPSLLGLDVDNNLRRIVGYLQSVETPPATIAKYLETSL